MNAFLLSVDNAKSHFDSFFLPFIKSILSSYSNSRVSDACLYSLEAGGKRIRPIIAINSYYGKNPFPNTFFENLSQQNILNIASALECLHTYSLIHDDLPSMDDDDLRRGRPTCHKQFDVPTAILAGDALNSLGFYILSLLEVDTSTLKSCFTYLHEGVGIPGMITGQMEDLQEEGKALVSIKEKNISREDRLESIHSKKTGALIVASFLLGNRLREDYSDRENLIRQYGKEIGLLFQITDDILDVEGNELEIGKTPGKDQRSGKLTYPALYGMEQSKKLRENTKERAISIAKQLKEEDNSFLIGFPNYLAERKN